MFFLKRLENKALWECLLCTLFEEEYSQYGTIVGERLFGFHERPDFALEGQQWTCSCKCGDDEESNVQTQFKEYIVGEVLCDDKIELEGLRKKSSSLEELCNLLTNEKHNLLNERSVVVSQLESVETKFDNLEKRFTKLEENYVDMEKNKETRVNQVEELHLLLLAQK